MWESAAGAKGDGKNGVKLIVGLGNPGCEYQMTPHNLGFMAVERLAETCGVRFSRREARARAARAEIEGEQVVLAKPQTFMNLSGLAVGSLLKKWEASAEDLIVLVFFAPAEYSLKKSGMGFS